jgi:O-antigen biosynthesis protein WbqP
VYRLYVKRVLDILCATLAFVALSPLFLIASIAILLDDGRPVIFRQKRVGQNGREFTLYKFRSMAVNSGDVPSSEAGALRVTAVGRVLRRSNIDEIPQLLNIIRGDMSIVGPRPALSRQVQLNEMRRDRGAHLCRPGLTGLAQVNSYDGMPEVEKADWDGRYAERITLVNDVAIIMKTFGYLLRRPPVY